jgi:hypothetical protein
MVQKNKVMLIRATLGQPVGQALEADAFYVTLEASLTRLGVCCEQYFTFFPVHRV